MFCTEIEVIYFDSFGVEHVPKEIAVLNEKDKYVKMKEDMRIIKSSDEGKQN